MTDEESQARFAAMVASKASRDGFGPVSDAIEMAFATVPRRLLLGSGEWQDPADLYSDQVLVVRREIGGEVVSTASQPTLVAGMLRNLDLAPGMKVLEIGTGVGYNAALMAELVGDPGLVTTVEIDESLAESTSRILGSGGYGEIKVLCGDGWDGDADAAPFDRVIVTLAAPDLSPHWIEQLVPDGVMVVPVEHGGPGAAPLCRLLRQEALMIGSASCWTRFIPLRGSRTKSVWAVPARPLRSRPDRTLDLPRSDGRDGFRPWSDFAFYLAMSDRRAWIDDRIGIWDESGTAIVEGSRIDGWGDEALVADLQGLVERWRAAGGPKLAEWRLAFGQGDPPDPNGGLVLQRSQCWEHATL